MFYVCELGLNGISFIARDLRRMSSKTSHKSHFQLGGAPLEKRRNDVTMEKKEEKIDVDTSREIYHR